MSNTDIIIGFSTAGTVAVCLFAAAGVTAVVWFLRRRRNKSSPERSPLLEKRPLTENLDVDSPSISETIIDVPDTLEIISQLEQQPIQIVHLSKAKQTLQDWLNNRNATHPVVLVQYMQAADSEKNIQLNLGEETIKFATIQKLIENLIKENSVEPFMREQFFATYTSFTTSDHLLSLLITAHDFYAQNPTLATKCISLIKYWLEHYLIDLLLCHNKNDTLVQLTQFILRMEGTEIEWMANFLCEKALKKKISVDTTFPLLVLPAEQIQNDEEEIQEEEIQQDDDYEPLYPDEEDDGWKRGEFNVLEWPATEIARQLTLIEISNFANIPTHELVGGRYSERNMRTLAPNLTRTIDHFNSLSQWICSLIVNHDEIEMRAATIMYFVDVMEKLIGMGNFNTLMSIYGAINNSAIGRLKHTMDMIAEESAEMIQMIDELTSSSKKFSNLRDAFQASSNCMPYLGIYLGDLAQIEGINKNKKSDDGIELINWNRSKFCTNILRQIQHFQNSQYKYVEIPFLKNHLSNVQSNMNEDQIFERSLEIEPREA
jgi:hypothetical protein